MHLTKALSILVNQLCMPNSITKRFRCIVVDDEPMARDILHRYIDRIPNLELVAEFGNAIDAALFLQSNEVDIAFLDIRMPQLTGVDLVKSLHRGPKIIFTTAFKEYAFEGFELEVTDYLLKPVRFERFLRAIGKALPNADVSIPITAHTIQAQETVPADPFIYLKVDRKMVKINLEDILYIESDRDYVRVKTTQGQIMARQTIAAVEAMLSSAQFIRIHRSFIVSLRKVRSFTHEIVEVGKDELPIGKLYRNQFLRAQGTA